MQQFRNRNVRCLLKGLVDLALRFARPVGARRRSLSSNFRAGIDRICLTRVDFPPYVVPHALDDRLPGRIGRTFLGLRSAAMATPRPKPTSNARQKRNAWLIRILRSSCRATNEAAMSSFRCPSDREPYPGLAGFCRAVHRHQFDPTSGHNPIVPPPVTAFPCRTSQSAFSCRPTLPVGTVLQLIVFRCEFRDTIMRNLISRGIAGRGRHCGFSHRHTLVERSALLLSA